jgi:beta-glucanase (GH16 family)
MRFPLPLCFVFLFLFSSACTSPVAKEQPASIAEWTLVWQDAFDGVHVNEAKWNYETGGHGWGNNELQYYTGRKENVYVEDGFLIIEARKEIYENRNYTSARLTTKNKGDWLYGKFEVRAKLPKGKGLWPAIWMLPTDWEYGGWAASGEIDIMELVGDNPSKIYGSLHFGGVAPSNTFTNGNYSLKNGSDFSQAFHRFAIEWDTTAISWFVDDSLYATQTAWYSSGAAYPAPFDKRFHFLLNVAVGGNWPGSPDSATLFPQRMYVDYVRVYRKAQP